MLRNLILTRDLSQPLEPSASSPPTSTAASPLRPILRTTDPLFPALDQFCSAHRFPPSWPARMLDAGAQALLTFDNATPAAAGWMINKPFHIEEIRRTLDAGPDADYYFGDFVAPQFRSRHLQRLLIQQRLELSREAGRRRAIALTRDDNPPSLKSYTASGFIRAAEFRSRHIFRWQFDRLILHSSNLPPSLLSPAGIRLPLGATLRRR